MSKRQGIRGKSASTIYLLSPATPKNVVLFICLLGLVASATVATYWPVLSAQALNFDDSQFVTDNPLVQNPSWHSAGRFLTEVLEPSTVEGYYLPISMISLMLDYKMGGRRDDLSLFHRTSLALHVINTILIVLLLFGLFRHPVWSVLTGLLFGLHPLTVEPVAWIGERKTLLATFFTLLCLLAYLRYARRGGWGWPLVALLLYVLACMSKPTAVMLPVLLLVIQYWPLEKLRLKSLVPLAPFFVIGCVFGVITLISHGRTAGIVESSEADLLRLPLVICHLIVFYFGKIIYPANLSSVYPLPEPMTLTNPTVLLSVLVTALAIVGILFSVRRTRALLAGCLFFLIAIFPTLGVVQYSWVTASDKYVYLPAIGLIILLAWGLSHLWDNQGRRLKTVRPILALAVLIVCAAEARGVRRYLGHWSDMISLTGYMLEMTPDSAPLHINMGSALVDAGELQRAEEHFRLALRSEPRNALAHINMGSAQAKKGQYKEAISHFREALQIRPSYAEAHNNLAVSLLAIGHVDEAIEHCKQAIQLKPDYPKPYYNLAKAYRVTGKLDLAIRYFRKALSITPDYAEAHTELGFVLIALRRHDEAEIHFRAVVKIKPNSAQAHDDLGFLLSAQRRFKEAIQQFQDVLAIDPNYDQAHFNLGLALQLSGDHVRAIDQFRRALEASPNDTEVHNKLAASLTVLGNYDQAFEHFQLSQKLTPDSLAALNGMAWILATHPNAEKRDGERAVGLAERAAELSRHKNAEILETLAAAYAAAGRFERAVATAQAALSRADASGLKELARTIQARLELYKKGEVHVERASGDL